MGSKKATHSENMSANKAKEVEEPAFQAPDWFNNFTNAIGVLLKSGNANDRIALETRKSGVDSVGKALAEGKIAPQNQQYAMQCMHEESECAARTAAQQKESNQKSISELLLGLSIGFQVLSIAVDVSNNSSRSNPSSRQLPSVTQQSQKSLPSGR